MLLNQFTAMWCPKALQKFMINRFQPDNILYTIYFIFVIIFLLFGAV